MKEIAGFIHEGAMAFLKREYKMVEKKTKRRQLVLQPSLDEWVELEAEKKGLSVNGFIHKVLEELMEDEQGC